MPIHHCRWVLGIPNPVHILVSQVQSLSHLLDFDFFFKSKQNVSFDNNISTDSHRRSFFKDSDTEELTLHSSVILGPFKQATKEGCAGPCAGMRTEAFT